MNCHFQRTKLILTTNKFHYLIDSNKFGSLMVNTFSQQPIESSPTSSKNNSLKKELICEEISKSCLDQYFDRTNLKYIYPYFQDKTSKRANYSFIIKNEVAEDISKKILEEHVNENFYLIEGNPGLGLLTGFLIKSGAKKIVLFGNSNVHNIIVKNLSSKNPDVIEIVPKNIFDGKIGGLLHALLNFRSFNKVVGVVPNYTFFANLCLMSIQTKLWNELPHLKFYVVTSLEACNTIFCLHKRKFAYFGHCLSSLLFEFKILSEYEENGFLPPILRNKKMVLLKISFKQKIFKDVEESDIKNYMAFVYILSRSKYQFIIPTLEKWFPNCGIKLIREGISLSNQTRDLSALESVKLFKIIKTCDSYENFRTLSNEFHFYDE